MVLAWAQRPSAKAASETAKSPTNAHTTASGLAATRRRMGAGKNESFCVLKAVAR